MNIINHAFSVLKQSSPIFALSATFFCTQVSAQKNIDAYFDHLFANNKMMGSVAISHRDSVIYTKAIGYADVDAKVMNNKDTKFRIASITKTFTGALVLKAIEEQKLKFEDKLSLYYPEVKNAEKITIRQLLNQRTGIFNFTEIEGENDWEKTFHTQKEFIDFFINKESNFEPGTDFEYSNTNYALLGFILEKIYQKPYAEILDEKICKPLRLKNTYYSFEVDSKKNEAISYNIQDHYIRNSKINYSNHPASGGITSTPTDVNKFLFALFNHKLINEESLKMMLPEKNGEYGMGITKFKLGNNEFYEHSGRVENYLSDYWYLPKENLGIVVFTNAINIPTEDVSKALTTYAYNNEPQLLDYNKTNELSVKDFANLKGTYYSHDKKESVTISSDGRNLVFLGAESGQTYFALNFRNKTTFEYETIKLVFEPKKHQFTIYQDDIVKIFTQKG